MPLIPSIEITKTHHNMYQGENPLNKIAIPISAASNNTKTEATHGNR
jgi:hypothetical protein